MSQFAPLKEWVDRQRTATPAATALRAAVAGVGVLLAVTSWWGLGGGAVGVGELIGAAAVALLACWAAAKPDGPPPWMALSVLGAWWWWAGWGVPWGRAVPVALVAVVFHQLCAWAAAAPMHSTWSRRVMAALAWRLVATLALSGAAIAGLLAVRLLPLPWHQGWLAAAAVGLVALVGAFLALRRGDDADA